MKAAAEQVLDLAIAGLTPAAALVALGLSWTETPTPTWGQVALTFGFHLERLAACEAPALPTKDKPRNVRGSGAVA